MISQIYIYWKIIFNGKLKDGHCDQVKTHATNC